MCMEEVRQREIGKGGVPEAQTTNGVTRDHWWLEPTDWAHSPAAQSLFLGITRNDSGGNG